MGQVVEFPYAFDGQKYVLVGSKPELVHFVPRARYGGRRAAEVPTLTAANSLCNRGCIKYEGSILYWIPENVVGTPSDFDWERLFTEAWEAITDDQIRDKVRALVAGQKPTEATPPAPEVAGVDQPKRKPGRPPKS